MLFFFLKLKQIRYKCYSFEMYPLCIKTDHHINDAKLILPFFFGSSTKHAEMQYFLKPVLCIINEIHYLTDSIMWQLSDVLSTTKPIFTKHRIIISLIPAQWSRDRLLDWNRTFTSILFPQTITSHFPTTTGQPKRILSISDFQFKRADTIFWNLTVRLHADTFIVCRRYWQTKLHMMIILHR